MELPTSLSVIYIPAILAVVLIYYLATSIISYRRLSHIPGPKSFALSVFPLLRLQLAGKSVPKFVELNRQYGPLVRIAPNILLTDDPDQVRKMAAPRSPYRRATWYTSLRLNPGDDNVLSVLDEKRHDELRRRMATAYSGKENVTLEKDIDDCLLELVRLIETRYLSVEGDIKPMELARKTQFFTCDVMSKIAFDSKFHDLRDDNDNLEFMREIQENFPVMFSFSLLPTLLDFMTRTGILSLISPKASARVGFGRIVGISKAQVAKRFDEEGKVKDQPDMLGSFLRHGLTREEAERESVLQIVAGVDTAATAMRCTMFRIITNPRVYAKVNAEIEAAMAAGMIPSDKNQVVSDAQAKELPYIQACIKEGLRWHPPLAALLVREVPKGGDTISGYFVPEGTGVGHSTYGIHHSLHLFGPDPTAFRPERWLLSDPETPSFSPSAVGHTTSPEHLRQMERNNDLIFSHGRFQCLGKPVAMIELNKIFIELLRRFDWELLDPSKPWETFSSAIHFQRGLWSVVRPKVRGE